MSDWLVTAVQGSDSLKHGLSYLKLSHLGMDLEKPKPLQLT